MYNELKGKTGVITGGSSGIGMAIAERFAAEGMNVVISYHHQEEQSKKLVEKIVQQGGNAVAIQVDVKKENDIVKLLDFTLATFHNLDVWVNNAGIQNAFPSHEMPLEQWQRVIDTNLTGVFLGSKHAINFFLKKNKKGTIINISSVHEIIPCPNYVHYAASKAGVKLLTQTLAREYASKGIKINAIGSGGISTPINEGNRNPQQQIEDTQKIPLGYVGLPHEIANVTAWLASNESSYITGTTIYADGGLLLYPSPDDNNF